MSLFQILLIAINIFFIPTLFYGVRAYNALSVCNQVIVRNAPPVSMDEFERLSRIFRNNFLIAALSMFGLVFATGLSIFAYLGRI